MCGETKELETEFKRWRESRPGRVATGKWMYGNTCKVCHSAKSQESKERKRWEWAEPEVDDEELWERYSLPTLAPVSAKERMLVALAACRGDTHFLAAGTKARKVAAHCKSVCAACPAKALCREVVDELEGHLPLSQAAGEMLTSCVWAGETPAERLRRRRRAAQRQAATQAA